MRFRFLQQRSTLRSPHWCFSSHDYRGIFRALLLPRPPLCPFNSVPINARLRAQFCWNGGSWKTWNIVNAVVKAKRQLCARNQTFLDQLFKSLLLIPKTTTVSFVHVKRKKGWWQCWVSVEFVEKKLEFPTKLVWNGENTCWSIWFTLRADSCVLPIQKIHIRLLWLLIRPESFEVFVLILWDQHGKSSMLQPWSNCGYEAEARKAVVRESSDDDSWATCLLGRDQSPRLPRKGLASVV